MEKTNAYGFTFNDVTEEEIIRGALQSGVAVFLHGRSSEGKSARVKQFDPDCEVVYLRNATPESLNGKSVYVQPITKRIEIPVNRTIVDPDTKEEKVVQTVEYQDVIVKEGYMLDVKPTWLMKLEERCEKEPDKLHVVFFDELTNALHAIQGMAFNIILDREVNGKWKLPDNARIAAAGNDLSDSVAANTLAEPLFNRFAHVYIETTLDSWLQWAKTPKKSYQRLDYNKSEEYEMPIHPAIYAFITLKGRSGTNVLRTKYDGIKPNADPRKWEMASKMLYATGQPEMLRSLIGNGLTKEFVQFCKVKIISIQDVILGNYSSSDYQCDLAQKYITALHLSQVDEENVSAVRDFVKKMGMEILTVFDEFWAKGNPERKNKLEDLRSFGLSWRTK